MDKLKHFQVVSHSYLNSISSDLATFWRLFAVVFCLCFSSLLFFIFSIHGGNSLFALHDPILQAELLVSFVFVVLFLIGCWFCMANNNLARQTLAFFEICAVVPHGQPFRAAARSTTRCRAPVFRFR